MMPATLVEFYDKSPLENIVSSLALKPGKVIFLGSNRKLMERQVPSYLSLLNEKGIYPEVECRAVPKNNLAEIQKALTDVVEENPVCVVDLTGGDELSLVAVGSVAGALKEKNISFHRVNISTRKVVEFFETDFDGDIDEPILSVAENIALYGGRIVYDCDKPDSTGLWDWNDGFIRDVNKMWEICKINSSAWNAQFKQLESIITGNTHVFCHIGHQDMYGESIRLWNKYVFHSLADAKLIKNFKYDRETFEFDIKNEQISRVLAKAGTILELKTYLTAKSLLSKKEPYFNDVMTGVYIDWDGVIHQTGDADKDTENEIDVICMKGLLPLFISCKNGAVDESELYKLDAVAEQFGGEYAKKALITNGLTVYSEREKQQRSPEYFRQRAKDMGIILIENADSLDDKEFSAKLKEILC